ncbi:hypothetical protein SFHH103_00425 [Sinorhizobium fredii HH103]|uniref:Uncharacterized protein n=1 Tax=Sinorhizobium fredii (strain HH103) TaxID=1117943 RepID=G9A124_SINF1|nr:hypothetical protein [Sinorhizobium fredii]CCE94925.1 hypothetical protein SFHH103_00425 [Sinorhizobium fredii HH103]
MKQQLDLFTWADSKPSNVINVMPAIIRKAAMEAIYHIPNRKGDGRVVAIEERRRA